MDAEIFYVVMLGLAEMLDAIQRVKRPEQPDPQPLRPGTPQLLTALRFQRSCLVRRGTRSV